MVKTKKEKLASSRAWKARNKERIRLYRQNYWHEHKSKERTNFERWKSANNERYAIIKSRCNESYRKINAIALVAYHRDPVNMARRNERERTRYREDVSYRLEKRLRSALTQAIRLHSNGRKTTGINSLLGCSMASFAIHIENQFLPGMTWDSNFHIDHRRPCASFDLTDPDQQRACFHYTNLQPLWPEDNRKKGAQWDGPK